MDIKPPPDTCRQQPDSASQHTAGMDIKPLPEHRQCGDCVHYQPLPETTMMGFGHCKLLEGWQFRSERATGCKFEPSRWRCFVDGRK
jgi:hypothetical protein